MRKLFGIGPLFGVAVLALGLALAGCAGEDGSDGAQGPQGPEGPQGPAGQGLAVAETCILCHDTGKIADVAQAHAPAELPMPQVTVTSASVNGSNIATVNFEVADDQGDPLTVSLTRTSSGNLSYLRFMIAKLVPGTSGNPDSWVNYLPGDSTYERVPAGLTDHGDGSYTYVFQNALTGFDATLTHRVVVRVSVTPVSSVANQIYDFRPAGAPVVLTRDIVTIEACNTCHDPLEGHGGGWIDTRACAVCHNPTMRGGNSAVSTQPATPEFDLGPMVHNIHAAKALNSEVDFSQVTYPQDLRNCRKCHDGPDGDKFKTRPTMAACATCHDISFVSPPPAGKTLHTGGAKSSNVACSLCHEAADIENNHLTQNSTPNNPGLPPGLSSFTYQINSVTVNSSNQAVVTFKILKDGAPLTLAPDGTIAAAGLTGAPSFLVCYALPQDDVAAPPADYNQLGKKAAQPASVSLAKLTGTAAGSLGTLTGDANEYTATLTGAAFPAGAVLRAVALQGYFSQSVGGETIGRHTPAVIAAVTGDAVRRSVVDTDKCLKCHEIIEGHGGNRVNNVQVCVTCHNPNLSSSGRAANLTLPPDASQEAKDATAATIAMFGSNPLLYPEAPQNMKELIHGIHGSAVRTTPYEFVRDRGTSGVFGFDFAEVTYPGNPAHCLTCHKDGTLSAALPANVLLTTTRTTTGNSAETAAQINAARVSVPNLTDWVSSPTASACYLCHDKALDKSHMEQTGGAIDRPRWQALGLPSAE